MLLNETVPSWVVDIVVEKKLPKFIKVSLKIHYGNLVLVKLKLFFLQTLKLTLIRKFLPLCPTGACARGALYIRCFSLAVSRVATLISSC